VWARIARYGWRRHTWGIYFSDNGRFWGEHHLRKKYAGYEEAIHVPFRMAVPGLGRRSFDELVANIDIAPTLVDLAGDDSNHDFAGP